MPSAKYLPLKHQRPHDGRMNREKAPETECLECGRSHSILYDRCPWCIKDAAEMRELNGRVLAEMQTSLTP